MTLVGAQHSFFSQTFGGVSAKRVNRGCRCSGARIPGVGAMDWAPLDGRIRKGSDDA